jgi:hypothetical protein
MIEPLPLPSGDRFAVSFRGWFAFGNLPGHREAVNDETPLLI